MLPPSVSLPSALALCLPLLACGPRLPLPTFPQHEPLYQQAEYAHGASAVPYKGRLGTTDGLVAYLKELDGYLLLLRRLQDAQVALRTPEGASDAYRQRVTEERLRLREELDALGRITRPFLDLGASARLYAIIPELREALRLTRRAPIPELPAATLLDYLRVIGSDSAACGAEREDPLAHPDRAPAWFTNAQAALEALDEDPEAEAKANPAARTRLARLLHASADQRRAMSAYGPFRRIAAAPSGRGEVWHFQVGNVERGGTSRAVDQSPRAWVITCRYDPRGVLQGAEDQVLGSDGKPVNLASAEPAE